MPRPARGRLSPWIENLIMSYGGEEGASSSTGRLKAHVIGVGPMSQSQAQGSEGPTGLLFLSDGMVQIPAVLTASAWEHLQEQEDRESYTSLVNTTVCIQDYRLQFHMAHEQTKCRFFLSVGELATTAAGPVKDNTPCCTTLPSVRLKICKTWMVLLGQEVQDSQTSQCGFELSELLGEWQHDCLQAVLEDVRERVMITRSRPVSPQPSTSTYSSLQTCTETSTPTGWAVDRIRYKGMKCFSVPTKCLLIPEEDPQQLQTPPDVRNRTPKGLSAASEDKNTDLMQVCKLSETASCSVDDAEWRIAEPAVVEIDHNTNESSCVPVEDDMLHEDMFVGMIDIRPLSNPWDLFPPPCDTSSSSDASTDAAPTHSLCNPTAAEPKPDHATVLTSTQLPVHSFKESQQISEHSKGEHSYLLPYQKPPLSASLPTTLGSSASTSVSLPQPFTRLSDLLLATRDHQTDTAHQNVPVLDQQSQICTKDVEEPTERKYRKAKRKRSEPTSEALTTSVDKDEEEAHISRSPPSWLFDTQACTSAKEDSRHQQGQTAPTVLRKTPDVHSDGRPFSYSYQVSGQNLQDLSQFKVADSRLHWAVKYLVAPKQTDNPQNTSLTSNPSLSDRTGVMLL